MTATIKQIVQDAFIATRQGTSADFVICNDALRGDFIRRCQASNAEVTEVLCNTTLLNLRKSGRLRDLPATARSQGATAPTGYETLVFQLVRMLERSLGTNVDHIICDPKIRQQFDDGLVLFGMRLSAAEGRLTALRLRKSAMLRPEPVGKFVRSKLSGMIQLAELEAKCSQLPEASGAYIFFSESATLYIGKADNLRRRLDDHASTWTFRELVRLIKANKIPEIWLAFHETGLTGGSLSAYESELIQSQAPVHNRAGASGRGVNRRK
ncbi:MAG: GIY-YIG nuclease family protein [Phycisphaerales bacterium]|nr:GIY-YIG nuclease family protein [Phycisphaerales bacterium]